MIASEDNAWVEEKLSRETIPAAQASEKVAPADIDR